MGLFKNYINQTRKPEGVLGKAMLNGMNSGHAKMADWGMSYLNISSPERIADIGCGGGRNAAELMKKYPSAKMTALDYSPLSVQKTAEYNRSEIENGRCEAVQGDVSALDLEKNAYDLATAFETVYFWKGLEKCFGQVYQVLKKDGVFMIVNESDGTDKTSLQFEKMIDGMKCHTVEKITSALETAGFSEIQSFHHETKSWITVIAKK